MASSIVAPNSIVVENLLSKFVIELKNKKHVIMQVANKQFEGELRQQGDTVTVQQVPNMFGNIGGTAGDEIAESGWAIASFQLQITEVYQQRRKIRDIEEVQSNLSLDGQLTQKIAYASANNEDQFVASFFTDAFADNKVNDQSPVTLSASNTYANVTSVTQVLETQNAEGNFVLFVSPRIKRWMKLENILDSTEKGLGMRLNGEVGTMDGHRVLMTNNLPHVRTLTIDTNPTAGDTFTVTGRTEDATTSTGGYTNTSIVFTFVAAGTAAAAGEISLGATAADTQANVVNAVNGTGTAGASTYIDVSAANRTALKNAFINLSSFSSDVATLRTAVYAPVAETFTAGTNVFGADAELMTAVDNNSINVAIQMDKFKITDGEKSFSRSLLQEKVYGGAVLGENAKGIATCEVATGLA